MEAALTLDGTLFIIHTHEDGDIRFNLPKEMSEEVSLSPAAAQLLATALLHAVTEAERRELS